MVLFGWSTFNSTHGIYETKEIHEKNIEKFIEKQMKNDKIATFPNPGVPTTVIYSTFLDTRTGYLYDKNNSEFDFNKSSIYYYGGDSAVPSISTLFAGLKWAYEKENGRAKHGVQFVEYCSLLHKNSKYGFKKFAKAKDHANSFVALGCSCINDHGEYILDNVEAKRCAHSTMINDEPLINFLGTTISTEPIHDELSEYSERVRKAIGMYSPLFNYLGACNEWLLK